jgi:hypothetical protein
MRRLRVFGENAVRLFPLQKHGVDAEFEAARIADEMLDRGDIEGQRVWRRIRHAIVELQAQPQGKPN